MGHPTWSLVWCEGGTLGPLLYGTGESCYLPVSTCRFMSLVLLRLSPKFLIFHLSINFLLDLLDLGYPTGLSSWCVVPDTSSLLSHCRAFWLYQGAGIYLIPGVFVVFVFVVVILRQETFCSRKYGLHLETYGLMFWSYHRACHKFHSASLLPLILSTP